MPSPDLARAAERSPDAPIAFAGMMGAGKSTLGRTMAASLRWEFVDVDDEVAARFGCSVPEIFARHGEAAFREEERKVALALLDRPRTLVALGGGAIVDDAVREAWLARGFVFHLHAPASVLAARVADPRAHRPLLDGPSPEDLLRARLRARAFAYGALPFHVDTDGDLIAVGKALARRVHALRALLERLPSTRMVPVATAPGYPLWLTDGGLEHAAELMEASGFAPGPLFLGYASPLHERAASLSARLARTGYRVRSQIAPSHEHEKTVAGAMDVVSALLEQNLPRRAPVLALGGGVTSDAVGFAASIYKRGLPTVVVPTTLLSMVDASVGGKTGVDTKEGKNLVGTFHAPAAVLVDTRTLESLPERELASGRAEVVKHALLGDPELFAALELARFRATPESLARALLVKVRVVEEDPYEDGPRALLNLGHTFGHALEKVTGYALTHGEAVGLGLIAAAHLSGLMRGAHDGLGQRVERAVAMQGLPTRVPGLLPDAVIDAMAHDKKASAVGLRFVIPTSVGACRVVDAPERQIITLALDAILEKPR